MIHETEHANDKLMRNTAGGLLIVAGLIHGVVAPEFLRGWWGYGTFFLVAAIAQIIYGFVIIMRPWRYDERGHFRRNHENYAVPVYIAGILGNAALIVLYIISRTVGVPFFGPEAGMVLPVTPISLLAEVVELSIIVLLSVLTAHTLRLKSE